MAAGIAVVGSALCHIQGAKIQPAELFPVFDPKPEPTIPYTDWIEGLKAYAKTHNKKYKDKPSRRRKAK